MLLDTVKIAADNQRGFKIINVSDFDPARHKVFGATPEPEPFTREAIEAMTDKDAIADLMEAHGLAVDKRLSADKLRAALIAAMFLEV